MSVSTFRLVEQRPDQMMVAALASARTFVVTRADSATDIDAALSEPSLMAPTGFQRAAWLHAIYCQMAPQVGARPLVLTVRESVSGGIVCALALVIVRESSLRIARFADLGVNDYNAALVGPLASQVTDWSSVVAAIKRTLTDCDVLHFERMPHVSDTLLSSMPNATPARHSGNALTVADSVDSYIAGRGKKYRKEVERCFRLLSSAGSWEFARATTPDQIMAAYDALEQQQGERHADKHDAYTLSQPHYAEFYRAVLANHVNSGAVIFTIKVDGRIIAVLLGAVHQSTFLLLRIANGGEAWRHLSPGRLIVVCAMRELFDQGVATFDMGIGDYQFKRGFGTEPIALVDLVQAVSFKGMAWVAAQRLKTRLRQNERLRSWIIAARTRLRKS